MAANTRPRFDPVDREAMLLTARLSVGQRVPRLLDPREVAVGLIRGRLRGTYPGLSLVELNMKVLEELDRVRQPTGCHRRPGRTARG